jgi:hypothetical protein
VERLTDGDTEEEDNDGDEDDDERCRDDVAATPRRSPSRRRVHGV